jgi:hypothetical protein
VPGFSQTLSDLWRLTAANESALCHIAISTDNDNSICEGVASKRKNHKPGPFAGHIQQSTAQQSAADGNNLGEFLDRVARQMLLGLHNATTLLLSPDPIKLQPAFFDRPLLAFGFAHSPSTENRFHANCLWCQFASFSLSGHPSRRESLRAKAPARRALSTVEPQTRKPAQRVVLLRTTLTGADEPYNGRGDSRHDHLIYFTLFTGELLITSTFA